MPFCPFIQGIFTRIIPLFDTIGSTAYLQIQIMGFTIFLQIIYKSWDAGQLSKSFCTFGLTDRLHEGTASTEL